MFTPIALQPACPERGLVRESPLVLYAFEGRWFQKRRPCPTVAQPIVGDKNLWRSSPTWRIRADYVEILDMQGAPGGALLSIDLLVCPKVSASAGQTRGGCCARNGFVLSFWGTLLFSSLPDRCRIHMSAKKLDSWNHHRIDGLIDKDYYTAAETVSLPAMGHRSGTSRTEDYFACLNRNFDLSFNHKAS